MKIKSLLTIILLGLFLISFSNALTTEISFAKNSTTDIKVVCINSGYCSSSATCNASVFAPDNTIIVDNGLFTNQNSYHNYTLTPLQTSKLGLYKVQGFCNDGSFSKDIDFNFIITNDGLILSKAQSNIYIMLISFAFLMFIMMLIAGIGLPFSNPRGSDNELLSVEIKKYPKLASLFLSYLLFVWLINLLMTASMNLVSLTQFTGFFEMLFTILMAIAWPLFFIMIWSFFILAKRDLKLIEFMESGFKV